MMASQFIQQGLTPCQRLRAVDLFVPDYLEGFGQQLSRCAGVAGAVMRERHVRGRLCEMVRAVNLLHQSISILELSAVAKCDCQFRPVVVLVEVFSFREHFTCTRQNFSSPILLPASSVEIL